MAALTVAPLSRPLPHAATDSIALRRFNPGAPICFVHVMKAAGTTVRLVLENAFDGETVYPSGSPVFKGRYIPLNRSRKSGDDLKRYAVLSGHFGAVVSEELSDSANLFAWLREPGDRVISEFFFVVTQERREIYQTYVDRLDAGERPETVFLDWLRDVPPDFHRQMSQLVCGNGLSYPDWREAHPDVRLEDAALEALRRCFFIGLLEDQERSLDALCAITSILPPARIERRNFGTRRPSTINFTAEEQAEFDALLVPDRAFYAIAREVYDRQMAELAERSRTEPALALIGDRSALRTHLLARADTPTLTEWSAWDRVLAENLDGREELRTPDGGVVGRWRWTAPKPDTFLYFRLPRRTAFELTITLNPATPIQHAEQATLQLCGNPVPLMLTRLPDERIELTALIPRRMADRLPDLAELHLHTPTMLDESKLVPYPGTRMLGLALESISARPVSSGLRRALVKTRLGKLALRIANRAISAFSSSTATQ